MKVLNIGSLNIDYVYDVEGFVRKGETISSTNRSVFAGGKGLNQSLALGRAGIEVFHAGLIGEEGAFLRDLLAESGVNVDFVRLVEGCPSGHAVIQRDRDGDNCIILFGGANHLVDEAFVDEVLESFSAGDWLLLQNETTSLAHAIDAAKRRGMWVALNPSPVNDSLFVEELGMIDCFILNEGEAARLTGVSGSHEELLRAMGERYPGASVVLTLGEDGSLSSSPSGIVRQEAFVTEVADTTAAGDTFTGYFLAEMANGSAPSRSLEVASAAASIAVSRRGAAPSIPRRCEVDEFLACRAGR